MRAALNKKKDAFCVGKKAVDYCWDKSDWGKTDGKLIANEVISCQAMYVCMLICTILITAL